MALALLHACLVCGIQQPLKGKVACVTGASRGIGRGIAFELAMAGAEVYVTGRSRDGQPSGERTGTDKLTIDSTVRDIQAASGVAHAVECDHTNDAAVASLFSRIADEQDGCLDILVNNAFSAPPNLEGGDFRARFWTQGAPMWDAVHGAGLRGHYMAACHAVPLMLERGGGLLVQVSSFGGVAYTFNVAYGVAKAAVDRLTSDMARELKGTGVRAVSLYPGVVRTEGNLALDAAGVWEEASGGLDLGAGETPRFSGRAVVALATSDPEDLESRSGSVQVVAELAREKGFTDVDGRQPPSIRSLAFLVPNYVVPALRDQGVPVPEWVGDAVPDFLLPWDMFRQGPPA